MADATDITQLPGLVIPVVARDELVIYRNGVPHRVLAQDVVTAFNTILDVTTGGDELITETVP